MAQGGDWASNGSCLNYPRALSASHGCVRSLGRRTVLVGWTRKARSNGRCRSAVDRFTLSHATVGSVVFRDGGSARTDRTIRLDRRSSLAEGCGGKAC
jgi:hypothetical protein